MTGSFGRTHNYVARLAVAVALLGAACLAWAGDVGHFIGGIYDNRDYFIPPEPGIYGAAYNYFYRTERFNDNTLVIFISGISADATHKW